MAASMQVQTDTEYSIAESCVDAIKDTKCPITRILLINYGYGVILKSQQAGCLGGHSSQDYTNQSVVMCKLVKTNFNYCCLCN